MTTRCKKRILVVANVTAISDELVRALEDCARRGPTEFTLIVPATRFGGGPAAARARLEAAVDRLRTQGLQADGAVGHGDPIVAVSEAWDPKRYDEIVVSTLPMRISKWLHSSLPQRISGLTGAPVAHVIARPQPPIQITRREPRPRNALGPLSVLGWGGHPSHGARARSSAQT